MTVPMNPRYQEWITDRRGRMIVEGVDYDCTSEAMVRRMKKLARRHIGMRVDTRIDRVTWGEDRIYFTFIVFPDDMMKGTTIDGARFLLDCWEDAGLLPPGYIRPQHLARAVTH
jgi:hypothetical protein